jgi:hypothetical protein
MGKEPYPLLRLYVLGEGLRNKSFKMSDVELLN